MRERAQALGRTLNARMQVHGFDAIAQLVEAGLGVAVLPAAVAQRFAQGVSRAAAEAQRRLGAAPLPAGGAPPGRAAAVVAALRRGAVRRPSAVAHAQPPSATGALGSHFHARIEPHHDRPHAVRQALGRPRRPHRGRRHHRPLHRPPPGARGDQPAGLRRACAWPAARSGAPARSWPRPTTTRPPPAGSAATTASPTRSASCRSSRSTPTSRRHGAAAYFPFLDKRQGIVHVIGPENGATLPGMTVVCGDSHTSTHGAFGALALRHRHQRGRARAGHADAAGQEDEEPAGQGRWHAAARLQRQGHRAGHHRPHRHRRRHRLHHRVRRRGDPRAVDGRAHDGVQHGHRGRRTRRAGRRRRQDDRLREGPARSRRRASSGSRRSRTGARCTATPARTSTRWSSSTRRRSSRRSPGARRPRWCCRSKTACPTPKARRTRPSATRSSARWSTWACSRTSRSPTSRIDKVFIGSCTNSRIEDLREAAAVVRRIGERVAPNVKLAMVVPGSGLVKAQAEKEGLHEVFKAAGFEWREPGCSMCLAMNADRLEPGERCASTSNRNFEGRQGAGGRTHLVSPAMAAAAALNGHFVDVRRIRLKEDAHDASLHRAQGPGRADGPRQRRHRRDHPEAVPEVDPALGLRPEPVRRLALPRPGRAGAGPGARASPTRTSC